MMKQAASKHTRQKAASTKKSDMDSPVLLVKHIGLSVLLTSLVSVLLVTVFSLLAYFGTDSDKWTMPLGLVASALTALFGGMIASRIHGHSALICGLLNGSLMMALMMLLSLLMIKSAYGYSAGISCLIHTAFLLFSVAGAYLGAPKADKTRKRKARKTRK